MDTGTLVYAYAAAAAVAAVGGALIGASWILLAFFGITLIPRRSPRPRAASTRGAPDYAEITG